jgi:hypothetical protein
MTHRYKIRMYGSADCDGSLAAGTIVMPTDRRFSMNADSADQAERKIRKDVIDGILPGERVYQICPAIGNPEPIRTLALCHEGNARQVILESPTSLYSEFRRLRYMEEEAASREASLDCEAVQA